MKNASFLVFALIGAYVALSLLGARDFSLGALSFRLTAAPSLPGRTEIEVPPLGQASARTHPIPIRVRVTLRGIDVATFVHMVEARAVQGILPDLRIRIRTVLLTFVLWLGIVAAGGAAIGVYAAGHRTTKMIGLAAGLGFLLVLTLAIGTYLSYDLRALESPRFDGSLAGSPWLWEAAGDALRKFDDFSSHLHNLGDNLTQLYGRLEYFNQLGGRAGDFRFLLVSDIHNNVAALDLLAGVAEAFDVSVVIDAGDLGDWGTALEGLLLTRLSGLEIPYILVPGNHESPASLEQIRLIPNIRVLESGWEEVQNVVIIGVADPASRRASPRVATTAERNTMEEQYIALLNQRASLGRGDDTEFTILVGHYLGVLESVARSRQVDLLVAGHEHRLMVERVDGTFMLNPGTTGGAGLRGLQKAGGTPFTMLMLHFSSGERTMLEAIDSISVEAATASFRLKREFSRQVQVSP